MNTIYIDVLIGLNFFINYYILLAVKKISRFDSSKKRFIFSSIIASLSSLVIFLPEINLVLSLLLKLLITLSIVFVAFSASGIKKLMILTSVYFGISFLYAGTMFFIWSITRTNEILINNSVVYINISPEIFILSVLIVYLTIVVIKKVLVLNVKNIEKLDLRLKFMNRDVTVACMFDSGNFLQDAFSDYPVIIIDNKTSVKLSGYTIDALKKPEFLGKIDIRIIPCSTVTKSGVLYGYKIDSAEINIDKKEFLVRPVIVAVSENELKNGYSALIGESFYKECKEKIYAKKDKVKIINTYK